MTTVGFVSFLPSAVRISWQTSLLRACFTEDMRAASQYAIGIGEGDSVQSALEKIEHHLRQQRSIAIRTE